VVLEEENSGTPNLTQERKRFALKTNLDTAGNLQNVQTRGAFEFDLLKVNIEVISLLYTA
jgi:hypothetical protein